MINTAIDNSRTSYLLFRLYQLRIVASFLALMLLASPIYAQAGRALEAFINVKLITAHEKKNASMTIPPEIVFLSMGPINSESSSLRFVIRLDEIYNSIVIEEIQHGTTEGDPVRLLHSYFIGDTDITRATGHKELRNLEFRRWITWDEFELKINNQTYRVQYTTAHEFAIRPVKK